MTRQVDDDDIGSGADVFKPAEAFDNFTSRGVFINQDSDQRVLVERGLLPIHDCSKLARVFGRVLQVPLAVFILADANDQRQQPGLVW